MSLYSFYSNLWQQLKSMEITSFNSIQRLGGNINYIRDSKPEFKIYQAPGSSRDEHHGGSRFLTVYRSLTSVNPEVELDKEFDYRNRNILLLGFMFQESTPNSRLPGGVTDNYLGRYRFARTGTLEEYAHLDGETDINTSRRITIGVPQVWGATPESRVNRVFYSGDGLNTAPKLFDMFNYNIPLWFCVIRSPDSHYLGVYPNNFDFTQDFYAYEEYGSFVFLWVDSEDGKLKAKIYGRVLRKSGESAYPVGLVSERAIDSNIGLALTVIAGPKHSKE